MDINAAFPSTWLKNSDLNGRPVKLTMKEVALEEVGDDHKPVLYFQGAKKGLVLNKINSASIASAYGNDTDNWNGKQIEVYPDITIFGGKPTPCIRVRPVKAAAAPVAPPVTPPEHVTSAQLDDEIPF
jgi:hypothetical protein